MSTLIKLLMQMSLCTFSHIPKIPLGHRVGHTECRINRSVHSHKKWFFIGSFKRHKSSPYNFFSHTKNAKLQMKKRLCFLPDSFLNKRSEAVHYKQAALLCCDMAHLDRVRGREPCVGLFSLTAVIGQEEERGWRDRRTDRGERCTYSILMFY